MIIGHTEREKHNVYKKTIQAWTVFPQRNHFSSDWGNFIYKMVINKLKIERVINMFGKLNTATDVAKIRAVADIKNALGR